tara:strand:+ start:2224 stop:2922 length:699 start_codon:yes stop_codon:yes gene_type:complete
VSFCGNCLGEISGSCNFCPHCGNNIIQCASQDKDKKEIGNNKNELHPKPFIADVLPAGVEKESLGHPRSEDQRRRPWHKTGWVWFWLILVWPVGVYGLIQRARPENRKWWCAGCLISILLVLLSEVHDDNQKASVARGGLNQLQSKELVVFSSRAVGAKIGMGAVKNIPSRKELEELVAAGLNLNNLLCAEITALRPLRVKSTYEVTCIAYRNGAAEKSYIVDALHGTAFEP